MGTFEARDQDPRCRLVVTLEDHGVLHGHMTFGPLRLWLRGAHADRGRLGVGALSTVRDGVPRAWVRLRAMKDALQLDFDPIDATALDPPSRSSLVVFAWVPEEG